ncbi:TnsA endonuclease N-terminal domain-containing protein [Solimonas sp. SE-A11]|uniref:TnsA endonuclease N-terminal domain-containing protein n=1 Tax=Solimonas sp. SE-A11 TaxID=3054954 RepID=UPI00259CB1B2|nr:TnsA endonuclease N-terminal domain-containing protein [Solimonas sp. SE-A11]MDM4772860.1 TnsA endonuclease N-terminal domain-containing protein [Solimonas sp. SE-A11]
MSRKNRDPFSRLKQGAGQGTKGDYVSPIHARDFSSRGQASRMRSHEHEREVQTFSGCESSLYPHLAFYPDFIDVREQFIHTPVTETLTICLMLGIRHPQTRGTLFPISTDFVVTRRNEQLLAIEVKSVPEEQLNEREQAIHMVRRIWWEAIDVPYRLIHTGLIDRTVSNNINTIQQHCWQYEQSVGIEPKAFTEALLRVHQLDVPLSNLLDVLQKDQYRGYTRQQLLRALSYAIRKHQLFVDLRLRIAPLFPLYLVNRIEESANWPW